MINQFIEQQNIEYKKMMTAIEKKRFKFKKNYCYKRFDANPKNFPHNSINFDSSTSNRISSDAFGMSN